MSGGLHDFYKGSSLLGRFDAAGTVAPSGATVMTREKGDERYALAGAVGGSSGPMLPSRIDIFDASDPAFQFAQDGDVEIYLVGGGGGGGSGADRNDEATGGGGGGGGTAIKVMNVNTTDTYALVIGAGGTKSALVNESSGGGDGGAGGTSTFTGTGVAITATGGVRGDGTTSSGAVAGSLGGVGSGGDYNYTGGKSTNLDSSSNRPQVSGGGAPNFGVAGANPESSKAYGGNPAVLAPAGVSAVYPGTTYGDVDFLRTRAAGGGCPFIDYLGTGGEGEAYHWSSTQIYAYGKDGTRGVGGGGGCAVNNSQNSRSADAQGGTGGNGCLFVVYY